MQNQRFPSNNGNPILPPNQHVPSGVPQNIAWNNNFPKAVNNALYYKSSYQASNQNVPVQLANATTRVNPIVRPSLINPIVSTAKSSPKKPVNASAVNPIVSTVKSSPTKLLHPPIVNSIASTTKTSISGSTFTPIIIAKPVNTHIIGNIFNKTTTSKATSAFSSKANNDLRVKTPLRPNQTKNAQPYGPTIVTPPRMDKLATKTAKVSTPTRQRATTPQRNYEKLDNDLASSSEQLPQKRPRGRPPGSTKATTPVRVNTPRQGQPANKATTPVRVNTPRQGQPTNKATTPLRTKDQSLQASRIKPESKAKTPLRNSGVTDGLLDWDNIIIDDSPLRRTTRASQARTPQNTRAMTPKYTRNSASISSSTIAANQNRTTSAYHLQKIAVEVVDDISTKSTGRPKLHATPSRNYTYNCDAPSATISSNNRKRTSDHAESPEVSAKRKGPAPPMILSVIPYDKYQAEIQKMRQVIIQMNTFVKSLAENMKAFEDFLPIMEKFGLQENSKPH